MVGCRAGPTRADLPGRSSGTISPHDHHERSGAGGLRPSRTTIPLITERLGPLDRHGRGVLPCSYVPIGFYRRPDGYRWPG